jgi:hypothetical protein
LDLGLALALALASLALALALARGLDRALATGLVPAQDWGQSQEDFPALHLSLDRAWARFQGMAQRRAECREGHRFFRRRRRSMPLQKAGEQAWMPACDENPQE